MNREGEFVQKVVEVKKLGVTRRSSSVDCAKLATDIRRGADLYWGRKRETQGWQRPICSEKATVLQQMSRESVAKRRPASSGRTAAQTWVAATEPPNNFPR